MKVAIVTTTINVPTVLSEYATMLGAHDGRIIVAGDRKTPRETAALCDDLGAVYLSPETQASLGYACSDILGWNTTTRRNIAVLEALKWGADMVVTVDDDNCPADGWWLAAHLGILGFDNWVKHPRSRSVDGWLNVGQYADDPFNARGLPMTQRRHHEIERVGYGPTSERVGIANGLTLGDPDMDALGRLDRQRFVNAYNLPNGQDITIRPADTWAPINAQNTSYVRELAPLMFVLPGIGRFDDIWASYIAMRALQETDWAVSFGAPYVIHERDRHPHNLWQDLENELYGLQMTEQFIAELRSIDLSGCKSIVGRLDGIAHCLLSWEFLPMQTRHFLSAWVRDVRRVL